MCLHSPGYLERYKCNWIFRLGLKIACLDLNSVSGSAMLEGSFVDCLWYVGCLMKIGTVEQSHLPGTIVPAAAVDIWQLGSQADILGIRKAP